MFWEKAEERRLLKSKMAGRDAIMNQIEIRLDELSESIDFDLKSIFCSFGIGAPATVMAGIMTAPFGPACTVVSAISLSVFLRSIISVIRNKREEDQLMALLRQRMGDPQVFRRNNPMAQVRMTADNTLVIRNPDGSPLIGVLEPAGAGREERAAVAEEALGEEVPRRRRQSRVSDVFRPASRPEPVPDPRVNPEYYTAGGYGIRRLGSA
jgi:hypothetical protein